MEYVSLKSRHRRLGCQQRYNEDRNVRQHQFFQKDVFGVDMDEIKRIQELPVPAGQESIYEIYKQGAAQCMTPQQLEAHKARWESRL